MKIVVTGGRNYNNKELLYKVLDQLNPKTIIQGGAAGADFLANSWALNRDVSWRTYSADWNTHGRAAGPIRNKQMLQSNQDAIVIAFLGGKGTEDCIRQAKQLGMVVLRVEE